MPNIRHILHNGETRSLDAWSRKFGVPASTIASRIRAGWDIGRALTERPDRRFAKGGRKKAGEVRACPRMQLHKGKRQAYARWTESGSERSKFFGPWGSAEAKAAYARFAAEWAAGGIQQ